MRSSGSVPAVVRVALGAAVAGVLTAVLAGCGLVLPQSSSTSASAGPATPGTTPGTAVTAATGVPSGSVAPAPAATSAAPAASSSASPAVSSAAPSTSDQVSFVDPEGAGMSNGGLVTFTSPSGRIRCLVVARAAGAAAPAGETARCDVSDYTYAPTAKPASCEFDWGPSFVLAPGRAGNFGCVSDAVDPGPVLAYGSGVKVGAVTCVSRQTGMTCTGTDGHGFEAARERYRLF